MPSACSGIVSIRGTSELTREWPGPRWLAELEFNPPVPLFELPPVAVPLPWKIESRLLLLETPRYAKSSEVSCPVPDPPTPPRNGSEVAALELRCFSKSLYVSTVAAPPAAAAPEPKPKSFLKPDFSLESPDVSSAKSGEWLVTLERRFLWNKNRTTRDPIKMVPPIEPTRPPMSFAFRCAVPPPASPFDGVVGTATKVVMVVSGNTLTVE